MSNERGLCGRLGGATATVSAPRRRLVQSCLALALLAGTGAGALATSTAAADDAEEVARPVERLHDALLAAAAAEGGAKARFERLLPVVREVFDYTTMSRVAVGSAWQAFSAAERRRLEEHFAAYAAANYAANFDDASGLRFRTVEVQAGASARAHVVTELVRPAKGPVVFDYVVHRTDAGPRIINVVVDGTMNELARRRAEFRSLLRAGGLENLLATLEAQTEARLG